MSITASRLFFRGLPSCSKQFIAEEIGSLLRVPVTISSDHLSFETKNPEKMTKILESRDFFTTVPSRFDSLLHTASIASLLSPFKAVIPVHILSEAVRGGVWDTQGKPELEAFKKSNLTPDAIKPSLKMETVGNQVKVFIQSTGGISPDDYLEIARRYANGTLEIDRESFQGGRIRGSRQTHYNMIFGACGALIAGLVLVAAFPNLGKWKFTLESKSEITDEEKEKFADAMVELSTTVPVSDWIYLLCFPPDDEEDKE